MNKNRGFVPIQNSACDAAVKMFDEGLRLKEWATNFGSAKVLKTANLICKRTAEIINRIERSW